MAADNLTSGVTGSIQKYINKKWMNQERRDYATPLANSNVGLAGKIGKGNAFVEFRKFDEYVIPTEASNDSPKYFAEGDADPTGQNENASIIQVPIAELPAVVSLGSLLRAVEPTDLVEEAYTKFELMLKRWVHRLVNDCMVRQIADTNSHTSGSYLPTGFNTMYAGGAPNFAGLTAGSVFTTEDFKIAAVALANSGVPKVDGGYVAFIDHSICAQLQADPLFFDAYKQSKPSAIFGTTMIDIYGIKFVVQHDEYRCHLPGAGGALTTRRDAGKVHLAHVVGKNAFGYLDLSEGPNRMNLKFKVQDISPTGNNLTIGVRVPFKCAVIDNDYGLNIAGCTNYDQTVSSFA